MKLKGTLFVNKKRIITIIGILSALLLGGWMMFELLHEPFYHGSGEIDPEVSQVGQRYIYYNGNRYEYNQNLTNILFMGIDKSKEVSIQSVSGKAGQADSVLLISLDKEEQTARIVHISRDTMTDIDIYDSGGSYFSTIQGQLALQYAYNLGGVNSCWAMKKTLQEVLFGLPIDAYISLNIDGVSILTDALGGITISINEDHTDIDPDFKAGSTIILNGEQAEKYIRSRDVNVTASNENRMGRQTEYLRAVLQTINERKDIDYEGILAIAEPYIVTDMNTDVIVAMKDYEYLIDEVEYLPGEVKEGESHEEFWVDDNALQALLIEMFYKPVS
ncbi:MAG: LCP family protein [Lachnospiraceae bacterium]